MANADIYPRTLIPAPTNADPRRPGGASLRAGSPTAEAESPPRRWLHSGPSTGGPRRRMDIEPIAGDLVQIFVDGRAVNAAAGETVLATLTAAGVRIVARDDRGQPMGAFCAMGVCYCCTVKIDDVDKQRSCQTIVEPGMRVVTQHDRRSLAAEGAR